MLTIIVTRNGTESGLCVDESELPTTTVGCSRKKLPTLDARAAEWVRRHTSAAFVRVQS